MIFLSLLRIFSYISVILTCLFFMRHTKRKYVLVGNVIVSLGLLTSVLSGMATNKVSNGDWVFYVINISVFIWAILHIVEFTKRK
jgi:hypothetical protein